MKSIDFSLIPLLFDIYQVKNYSTMCKITSCNHFKPRRNELVKNSCIRGFRGHYWLTLPIIHSPTTQREKSNDEKGREKCDTCGLTFACTGNLNRHKKLHAEYERFQCDVCLRTYSNLSNFKIHIPRHHPHFGIEITYSSTTEGAKERPDYKNKN